MPLMEKSPGCSALDSTWRDAGSFFSFSNSAARSPASLMRKVSTCISPCADDQRVPRAASRACGMSLGGKPMRAPVAGSATTLQPNSSSCSLCRRDEARAFGGRERAGDFCLRSLLEILDRGEHRIVVAADAAIVARPHQRRLDRQPLDRPGMPANASASGRLPPPFSPACGLLFLTARSPWPRRACRPAWARRASRRASFPAWPVCRLGHGVGRRRCASAGAAASASASKLNNSSPRRIGNAILTRILTALGGDLNPSTPAGKPAQRRATLA